MGIFAVRGAVCCAWDIGDYACVASGVELVATGRVVWTVAVETGDEEDGWTWVLLAGALWYADVERNFGSVFVGACCVGDLDITEWTLPRVGCFDVSGLLCVVHLGFVW